MYLRRYSSLHITCVILCCQLAFAQLTPVDLTITTVRGNGATNTANVAHADVPIVKVEDSAGNPIAGAKVTFLTPSSGASATFQGGTHTYSTTTGVDGQAAAMGFVPNRRSGQFTTDVTAEYRGQKGQTRFTETNMARVQGSGKAIAIVIVAGAVAVVAAVFLVRSVNHLAGR
jgi:hypothetical protein